MCEISVIRYPPDDKKRAQPLGPVFYPNMIPSLPHFASTSTAATSFDGL